MTDSESYSERGQWCQKRIALPAFNTLYAGSGVLCVCVCVLKLAPTEQAGNGIERRASSDVPAMLVFYPNSIFSPNRTQSCLFWMSAHVSGS